MQYDMTGKKLTEEEHIKDSGLVLDFDEIAKRGSMSKEEGLIAKWYGIYKSRQTGDFMARVVIPGGILSSDHAKVLADLSVKYAQGKISWTTRQAAQYHRLQLKELPQFLRDLEAAGLTTFHGCGDVSRNVVACPWAASCEHRRVDVTRYVRETAELLSASRDLDNLPRKFKVSFSGCAGACGQPSVNCMGAIAVARKNGESEEIGFKVVIGGGMGWKPFVAQEVYSFVPAEMISKVARGVAILFREHGDRTSRRYARLKFVVDRMGVDACRKALNDILVEEGVDVSRLEVESVKDCRGAIPSRPLRNVNPLDEQGRHVQRIMIPKGEMSAESMRQIAELAELYGDKHVYSSNRQNLEIHGVEDKHVEALKKAVEAIDFRADGFYGVEDVVTCVGTTYCPLAVTRTHDVFDAMQEIVLDKQYAAIRDKVLVNITGCPNSCGQYYIADIGLRGMRIREESGSVEGYEFRIGGTQDCFGEILGEFKTDDCLKVMRVVLDTFADACKVKAWDSLAEQVQAEGIEAYRKAIDPLGILYKKKERLDEYSSFTGTVSEGKDFDAIAKDVPCQDACPAKTNVPEYIRLIEEGKYAEAYRVNQEDNVLPGVLGRICTHPCQDDCRHNWTNTQGAVRICSLKRSAADRAEMEPTALEPYFDKSGKRVAIVGGGPAGLAAGRELKRFGHDVVIYDREDKLGGQVRYGVPAFRLPDAVLDYDIEAVLKSGIDVAYGKSIGQAELAELQDEYDAVLVATGANQPRAISMEGLEEGVGLEGLAFMRAYNCGERLTLGNDIVIIGGGFTAVDCARSARRMEPNARITIMYRRGVAQMAATKEELRELENEGVKIETLVTPVKAEVNGGEIKSLTFVRNRLGEVDASGKPSFNKVEGSEFTVVCSSMIYAIGQVAEGGVLGDGVEIVDGHRTSIDGVYVAGDFSMGNGDVIHAVADGKDAAEAIDEYLMGQKRLKRHVQVVEVNKTGRIREYDFIEPVEMAVLETDKREGDEEVELGYTDDESHRHARRCYYCNHKFEIDQDKCIHCDWCIRVAPRHCIKRVSSVQLNERGQVVAAEEVGADVPEKASYIWIDSDECVRCGNCFNICPTEAISLRKADRGCSCDNGGS